MFDFQVDLEQIRKSEKVPALVAGAYIRGETCGVAVAGKRKVLGKIGASIKDTWPVGSCTKPMTATLAGILIEQGQIDWNTKIPELIQDFEIHSGWNSATLEQLLSHHSGAPTRVPASVWLQSCKRTGTPTEQRIEFARGVLLEKPSTVPGSKFEYSNVGYAIAGLMLEAATKRDWESLMVSNIFTPLGMSSANFATPLGDQLEQPIGHIRINRKLEPLQPGAEEDSPPALGPAGTVNCSIEDLLKFAASHVGESPLVSRPTLERLHRRYRASEWSPGWCVVDRTWSGGYALFHYGSNWGSIASMWLAPLKNLAFVAASNANTGQKACDAAINRLIARFLHNED